MAITQTAIGQPHQRYTHKIGEVRNTQMIARNITPEIIRMTSAAVTKITECLDKSVSIIKLRSHIVMIK